MTLIKNVFKILATTALLSSANTFAADFLVDTTIEDSNYDAVGGWKYEIDKMDVQWANDGLVTVDIYTNFVDYNNRYGTGHGNGNIVLGDLLIGTNGANSAYNYAFVLSNTDRQEDKYYEQKHWDNTGTLTEISSTITSKEYHNNSSSVQQGQVIAGNQVGQGYQSAWSVDRQNTGPNHNNYDLISFSFNVNGIDAFQNASQLAFSWAMSCANDVVEGLVDVNRPTSVPEPTALLLVLFALGLIAKTRCKKAQYLSA
ncbi:MAG: PEP-CTERM sorting domain-containing protein [Colwellia sp.]|nr:PEP-CTERM sorting domain-containing protein [Colwellia sp.]